VVNGNNRFLALCIVVAIILSNVVVINSVAIYNEDLLFPISLKIPFIEPYITLAFLIKMQLNKIGIDVIIYSDDCGVWSYIPGWLSQPGADIGCFHFYSQDVMPNYIEPGAFSENSSLNVWGYRTSLDWDESLGTGKNEWMLDEIRNFFPANTEEQKEFYWNWQDYLMDEILPMYPLFSFYKDHILYYNNLEGFTLLEGRSFLDSLLQSWGKLNWNGLHDGQLTDEAVVIEEHIDGLFNPICYNYSYRHGDRFILNGILDKLIWYDNDLVYYPHLIEDWQLVDEYHIRFTLREGITWPGDPNNEFLNEPFDVDDVYFTFYCYRNVSSQVSQWENKAYYDWKDVASFKKVDSSTIDVVLEENPTENVYQKLFNVLSRVNVLPEHFLNQTQKEDGFTPDFTHPSWVTFRNNPFGLGPFELIEFIESERAVLELDLNSWWFNSLHTEDPSLNWINRLGDFNSSPSQIIIKVIPNYKDKLLEFIRGTVDFFDSFNLDSPDSSLLDFNKLAVQTGLDNFFHYLIFNIRSSNDMIGNTTLAPNDESLTKGLALRKAISYAIDRDEINNVLFGGKYNNHHYPTYPTLGSWLNPNIIKYTYNIEYAKAYLHIAGYDCGPFNWPSDLFPSVDIGNHYIGLIGIISIVYVYWKKKS
jgi:ABC-type transport system substrate-binding protein